MAAHVKAAQEQASAADGMAAAAAARLPERGRRLYRLLVSELYGSRLLEHAARLTLFVRAGAAAAGGIAGGGQTAISQNVVSNIVREAMCSLAGAYYRSAGATLGIPGTPDSRPDVPPPPWGPCAQYLALVDVVSALVAAGFGGGEDGKGAYGMPPEMAAPPQARSGQPGNASQPDPSAGREWDTFDLLLSMVEVQLDWPGQLQRGAGGGGAGNGDVGGDGGGARGGWSFLVGPRATHSLCMRVADLAIASGQDATATSGRQPGRGRGRLPADCAWHVAMRALVAARGLLLGPLSRRPGAAVDSPLLPVKYWEAVVRVLRMEAAPANVDEDLMATRAAFGQRLLHMMELPDMAATASLAPDAQPSGNVATAFSSGLVAGLERCSRFFGRSADRADMEMVCGVLLTGLATHPKGIHQLLAFGPPQQVAPLVATIGKLLHLCVDEAEAAVGAAEPASQASQAAAERAFAARLRIALQHSESGRGHVQRVLLAADSDEAAGVAACRRLVILASNIGQALTSLLSEPRVAALTSEGPAAVRPQLRQLLSFTVQRWLPALLRAALLAPHLPGYGSFMYNVALGSLDVWEVFMIAAAYPPRLASVRSAAEPLCFTATASASAGACTGSAANAAPGEAKLAAAADEAAAEGWRRWLRSGGGSPVPVLGMLLANMRHVNWCCGDVNMFCCCLAAAAFVEPEALRAELRAVAADAAAAPGEGGGGGGSEGAAGGSPSGPGSDAAGKVYTCGSGDRPSATATASASAPAARAQRTDGLPYPDDAWFHWTRNQLDAFLGPDVVSGGPELWDEVLRAEAALSGLAVGDGCHTTATTALAGGAGRGALCWAGALLSPAEAGAGLPTACANPRCTNLAGDSDADLATLGGGLRRCGGCGAVRYCSVDCQRAHWRAGHSAECGGGARRGRGGG
ncbi:hypothetical protein GPECTOR_69g432 [Gonium pectorale]|uniref:phytol kinase n=1 Tax=Gonium pectorale TaxID=33097 RepID=A0A150G385_GONPE|nr:hypothetical protein GPECTOR_69g432 [Gonium pectorale]|eukprot:KXZ44339.1 hypothetical protein GPECTOR_69g432 [Gonium pectorale]